MKNRTLVALLLFATTLLIASCAQIGNPDGGPYDEEPPKVLGCKPDNKAIHVSSKKISIQFDEYIKLENASEKVVVTPPQTEMPNIRVAGKQVKVDLYDDLLPNTTYTIDFGDAIVDNNEGNPMGFFTYSFSTGDRIDTMEVSGTVLNAEDLEPIKGMLVGLYNADSAYSDTILRTKAMERVGRTNGSGKFSIRGIAPGRYRAVALMDADGNYRFTQKSEKLAFDLGRVFETSKRPDFYKDTVWVDTIHWSKIRMIPYTHYLPDDIILRAFLEEGADHHLLKTERLVPERFTFYFTSPADSLPHVEGVNFDARCLVVEPSAKNDTITYWVTDTLAAYQDTLSMYLTYLDTDTLGQLVPRTDTLDITPKVTHEKQMKEKQKQIDDWQKDFDKRARRSKEPLPPEENPYLTTWLESQIKPGNSIAPNQPITITFNEPIERFDTATVHFDMKVDSDYVSQKYRLLPVKGDMRSYRFYAQWEAGAQYRLKVDSLAFSSVLGHNSRTIKVDVRVKKNEEFGTLHINVGKADSCVVVQLLSKSDKPVTEAPAIDGVADFYYLKPDNYYVRAYIDRNRNGKWDTGNYNEGLQPEEVFYNPNTIPIKAQWEAENDWDLRAIPLDEQKPKAITKQKPDKQKNISERNKKRMEEMAKRRKRS